MSHITIIPHDTEAQLRRKMHDTHDEAFKNRVKAILLALDGKKRYEISKQLTVDPKSVTTWLTRYNEKGTDALVTNKGGRPEGNPLWDAVLFTELAKEIDKGGYWSIPRMQEWLKKEKKKDIPEQTVWYRMDKLKYSYKSSRPSPLGRSTDKRESFKKGASPRSWSR